MRSNVNIDRSYSPLPGAVLNTNNAPPPSSIANSIGNSKPIVNQGTVLRNVLIIDGAYLQIGMS